MTWCGDDVSCETSCHSGRHVCSRFPPNGANLLYDLPSLQFTSSHIYSINSDISLAKYDVKVFRRSAARSRECAQKRNQKIVYKCNTVYIQLTTHVLFMRMYMYITGSFPVILSPPPFFFFSRSSLSLKKSRN